MNDWSHQQGKSMNLNVGAKGFATTIHNWGSWDCLFDQKRRTWSQVPPYANPPHPHLCTFRIVRGGALTLCDECDQFSSIQVGEDGVAVGQYARNKLSTSQRASR
ncbi:hypothetical protein Pst134EB_016582 [Puccinia striiformis f. sp. tritici]|nr:hypothetical protein Pst134EB_016582 [Puccinia striiformis f. sp. tritici]